MNEDKIYGAVVTNEDGKKVYSPDTLTDSERDNRLAMKMSAYNMLMNTDIDSLSKESADGMFKAVSEVFTRIPDDGSLWFGKDKTTDPRKNLAMMREVLKGNRSLQSRESAKFEAMSTDEKVEYADENESTWNSISSNLKGERGPGLLGWLKYLLTFPNQPMGVMAPVSDSETSLKIRNEKLNEIGYFDSEEKEKADKIGDVRRNLAKDQKMFELLARGGMLSERGQDILAQSIVDGELKFDDVASLSDEPDANGNTEQKLIMSAFKAVRGDRTQGRILGIKTDFNDGWAWTDRMQMMLYGAQNVLWDLVEDFYNMGYDLNSYLAMKFAMDEQQREDFTKYMQLRTLLEQANEQPLPEGGFVAQSAQTLAENWHWVIPYGVSTKAGAIGKVLRTETKLARTINALEKTGAAAKMAKIPETVSRMIAAEAKLAEGLNQWRRMTLFLKNAVSSGAAAEKVQIITNAARLVTMSSFFQEYIEAADAEGISREQSVPMALLVGWANSWVESWELPGVKGHMDLNVMKATGYKHLLDVLNAGKLGEFVYKRQLANFRTGAVTMVEESFLEEPVQQLFVEWGKRMAKSLGEDDWGKEFKDWFENIRENVAKDLQIYIDTSVDMLPGGFGYLTTQGPRERFAQRRAEWLGRRNDKLRSSDNRGAMLLGEALFGPKMENEPMSFADVKQRYENILAMIESEWSQKGAMTPLTREEIVAKAQGILERGGGVEDIHKETGLDMRICEYIAQFAEDVSILEEFDPEIYGANAKWQDPNLGKEEFEGFSFDPKSYKSSEDEKGKTVSADFNVGGVKFNIKTEYKDLELTVDEAKKKINNNPDGTISNFGASYNARYGTGEWEKLPLAEKIKAAAIVSPGITLSNIKLDKDGKPVKDAEGRVVREDTKLDYDVLIKLSTGNVDDVIAEVQKAYGVTDEEMKAANDYTSRATRAKQHHEMLHALSVIALKFVTPEEKAIIRDNIAQVKGWTAEELAAKSDVDIEEMIALDFEKYGPMLLDKNTIKGPFGRFQRTLGAFLGRMFGAKKRKISGYGLDNFYKAVMSGQLGSGNLGIERVNAAPKAEGETASTETKGEGDIPVDEAEVKKRAQAEEASEGEAKPEAAAKAEPEAAKPEPEAAKTEPEAANAEPKGAAKGAANDWDFGDILKLRIPNQDESVRLVVRLVVDSVYRLSSSYDSGADQSTQNRADDMMAKAKIAKVARKPDYVRAGAPAAILGESTLVAKPNRQMVVGNARAKGLKEGYKTGTATEYRTKVLKEAEARGIEVPEYALEAPVLVAIIEGVEGSNLSIDKLVSSGNESEQRAYNIYEQARVDAESARGLLDRLVMRADGSLDSKASGKVLNEIRIAFGMGEDFFLKDPSDPNSMNLTEETRQRIGRAILAGLLGSKDADTNVLRAITSDAKRLDIEPEVRGIYNSAMALLALERAKDGHFKLAEALEEALREFVNWREADERKRKEKGYTLDEWMKGKEYTWQKSKEEVFLPTFERNANDFLAEKLAQARAVRYSKDKEKRFQGQTSAASEDRATRLVSDYLREFVSRAMNVNTKADLFGTAPASAAEVMKTIPTDEQLSGMRFAVGDVVKDNYLCRKAIRAVMANLDGAVNVSEKDLFGYGSTEPITNESLALLMQGEDPNLSNTASVILHKRMQEYISKFISDKKNVNANDIEDLAGEIWYSFSEKVIAGKYDPTKSKVTTFLGNEARQRLWKWFEDKKKNKVTTLSKGEALEAIGTKSVFAAEKGKTEARAKNMVEDFLPYFSPGVRKVIRHYLGGSSLEEIARKLKVSKEKVAALKSKFFVGVRIRAAEKNLNPNGKWMDVAKRRSEVRKLRKEGKKFSTISSELGISLDNASSDAKYLRFGELDAELNPGAEFEPSIPEKRAEERRGKVYEMRSAGLGLKEIAEKLGVEMHIVADDMRKFKEEGITFSRTPSAREKIVAERRLQAGQMHTRGVEVDAIVDSLTVDKDVVYEDIRQYDKGAHRKIILARAKQIKAFLDAGESLESIADKLNTSVSILYRYAPFVRNRIGPSELMKLRREEVSRLWNSGIPPREIANQLGIELNIIDNDLVSTTKRYAIQKVRRDEVKAKVAELIGQGYLQSEIAKTLRLSAGTLNRIYKSLYESGELVREPTTREKVVELLKEGRSRKEICASIGISLSTLKAQLYRMRKANQKDARFAVGEKHKDWLDNSHVRLTLAPGKASETFYDESQSSSVLPKILHYAHAYNRYSRYFEISSGVMVGPRLVGWAEELKVFVGKIKHPEFDWDDDSGFKTYENIRNIAQIHVVGESDGNGNATDQSVSRYIGEAEHNAKWQEWRDNLTADDVRKHLKKGSEKADNHKAILFYAAIDGIVGLTEEEAQKAADKLVAESMGDVVKLAEMMSREASSAVSVLPLAGSMHRLNLAVANAVSAITGLSVRGSGAVALVGFAGQAGAEEVSRVRYLVENGMTAKGIFTLAHRERRHANFMASDMASGKEGVQLKAYSHGEAWDLLNRLAQQYRMTVEQLSELDAWEDLLELVHRIPSIEMTPSKFSGAKLAELMGYYLNFQKMLEDMEGFRVSRGLRELRNHPAASRMFSPKQLFGKRTEAITGGITIDALEGERVPRLTIDGWAERNELEELIAPENYENGTIIEGTQAARIFAEKLAPAIVRAAKQIAEDIGEAGYTDFVMVSSPKSDLLIGYIENFIHRSLRDLGVSAFLDYRRAFAYRKDGEAKVWISNSAKPIVGKTYIVDLTMDSGARMATIADAVAKLQNPTIDKGIRGRMVTRDIVPVVIAPRGDARIAIDESSDDYLTFVRNYGKISVQNRNIGYDARKLTTGELRRAVRELGSSALGPIQRKGDLGDQAGIENGEGDAGSGGRSQVAPQEPTTPNGRQKEAGVLYPDASTEIRDERFAVGAKRRADYRLQLNKHRPDLDADKILAELDKYNDARKEKATLNWVIKGAVILPEDETKIDEALRLANNKHVDVFKYERPMDIINEFAQGIVRGEKADPDNFPKLLTDKEVLPHGVTVYNVQDGEVYEDGSTEGQRLIRRILTSHKGEGFNCWCLVYDDGHGGVSSQAIGYWNDTYNSLPKRVAFKNGEIVAFMATSNQGEYVQGSLEENLTFEELLDRIKLGNPEAHEEFVNALEDGRADADVGYLLEWLDDYDNYLADELRFEYGDRKTPEEWWDMSDSPHEGIPIELPVPGDLYGRSADFEILSGIFVHGPLSGMWRGDMDNGIFEEWSRYSDRFILRQEMKNGKPVGKKIRFSDSGAVEEIEKYTDDAEVRIECGSYGTLSSVRKTLKLGPESEAQKLDLRFNNFDGNVRYCDYRGKYFREVLDFDYFNHTYTMRNVKGYNDFSGAQTHYVELTNDFNAPITEDPGRRFILPDGRMVLHSYTLEMSAHIVVRKEDEVLYIELDDSNHNVVLNYRVTPVDIEYKDNSIPWIEANGKTIAEIAAEYADKFGNWVEEDKEQLDIVRQRVSALLFNAREAGLTNPEVEARPGLTDADIPDVDITSELQKHLLLDGEQKRGAANYPDAWEAIKDIRFAVGAKRRNEYAAQLAKYRGDMSEDKRNAVLAELDKYNDTKKEKLTLHWVVKGAIVLPEDEYKVDTAIKVAEAKKVDAFKYKSPMELINAFPDYQVKLPPIDPATVPAFSNPQDRGNGVVVYDVDEETGQAWVRKVINTHWGKDASPWCLAQGDGKGNLSENAEYYWKHYSALPKKIAFVNGKLAAFMATDKDRNDYFINDGGYGDEYDDYEGDLYQYQADSSELENFLNWVRNVHPEDYERVRKLNSPKEEWWDREDKSHDGVMTVAPIPDDRLGRYTRVMVTEDGPDWAGRVGAFKGDKKNGIYAEWIDDHSLVLMEEYKDGKPTGWRMKFFWDGELHNTTWVEQIQGRDHYHTLSFIGMDGDIEINTTAKFDIGPMPAGVNLRYQDGIVRKYIEYDDNFEQKLAYTQNEDGKVVTFSKKDENGYVGVMFDEFETEDNIRKATWERPDGTYVWYWIDKYGTYDTSFESRKIDIKEASGKEITLVYEDSRCIISPHDGTDGEIVSFDAPNLSAAIEEAANKYPVFRGIAEELESFAREAEVYVYNHAAAVKDSLPQYEQIRAPKDGNFTHEMAKFPLPKVELNTEDPADEDDEARYSVGQRKVRNSEFKGINPEVMSCTSHPHLVGHDDVVTHNRYEGFKAVVATEPDRAHELAKEYANSFISKTRTLGNYLLGKYFGDWEAALRTARKFYKPIEMYPITMTRDAKKPVFVPIEGGESKNLLPKALAQVMTERVGGRVDESLKKSSTNGMHLKTTQERLAADIVFTDWPHLKEDEWVYIVDDVWTTGATVRSAMDYLHQNGVRIAGVVTLAHAARGKVIIPDEELKDRLVEKAGVKDWEEAKQVANLDLDLLTGSEISAYLRGTGYKGRGGLAGWFESANGANTIERPKYEQGEFAFAVGEMRKMPQIRSMSDDELLVTALAAGMVINPQKYHEGSKQATAAGFFKQNRTKVEEMIQRIHPELANDYNEVMRRAAHASMAAQYMARDFRNMISQGATEEEILNRLPKKMREPFMQMVRGKAQAGGKIMSVGMKAREMLDKRWEKSMNNMVNNETGIEHSLFEQWAGIDFSEALHKVLNNARVDNPAAQANIQYTEPPEESGKGTGEADTRKDFKGAVPELKDPAAFAKKLLDLMWQYWRESKKLGPSTQPWSDVVSLQFARRTAANVYAKLAQDLMYSSAREIAMRQVAKFRAAPTLNSLFGQMQYTGEIINARRIREDKEKLLNDLKEILETNYGATGRFKVDREELRRKVSAELELRARYMKHAMWLGKDAANAEAEMLQEELEQVVGNYKDAERDYHQSRKFLEITRKINILREFGGLKDKSVGEIEQAIEYWKMAADGAHAKIVEEMQERELRTVIAADALAKAMRNPKLKTRVEGGFKTDFNNYMLGHMGFTALLQDMIRYSEGNIRKQAEVIIDYISREVQKAGDKAKAEERKQSDAFVAAVERIYAMPFKKAMARLAAEAPEFMPFMNTRGGKVVKPTRARAMQLMTELMQGIKEGDSYYENVIAHGRKDQMAQLDKLLSIEDKNLIAWIGKWYERNREGLSNVCEDLFGMGVYSETPNYFPAKMLIEKDGLETVQGVNWRIFPKALTPRVRNQRDFDTSADIIGMWMDRMHEAAQWKAHAKLGLEMRGIFGRSHLREAIAANHGSRAEKMVQEFITDILQGEANSEATASGVEKAADWIRGWTALAALGGNIGVTAKQVTSIPAFGFEIGLINTAKHVATAFTPAGMAAMREIWNSEQRKTRWSQGNSEAVQNAINNRDAGPLRKLFQASMITNKVGDVVPALVVGQGIYRDLLSQNLSPAEAMAKTWMIIERTQQSSRIENQPKLQRRVKMGKLLYQFLSTQQQYLQYEMRAIRELAARKDRPAAKKLINSIIINHLLLPSFYFWMGELFKSAVLGSEPPEDQLKQWMAACLTGPFAALFVLGFTGRAVLDRALYGKRWGHMEMLPMESFIKRTLVSDPMDIVEAVFDREKTWEEVLDETLQWGASMNATIRDIKKFNDNHSGEGKPKKKGKSGGASMF